MLEKELRHFTIQKDDLRFSLYNMIIVMLQDNIQMRLWINELMQNQIDESQRRLDQHARHQVEGPGGSGGGRTLKGDLIDDHDEYPGSGNRSRT